MSAATKRKFVTDEVENSFDVLPDKEKYIKCDRTYS